MDAVSVILECFPYHVDRLVIEAPLFCFVGYIHASKISHKWFEKLGNMDHHFIFPMILSRFAGSADIKIRLRSFLAHSTSSLLFS